MDGQYGWTGKLISVDLTNMKVSKTPTSDFDPQKFIGGVGLNTKIFWELGCPTVDAFHPDSPIMISVGPLTGILGSFNRAELCGIAAHSYPKEMFSYSGAGGRFPAELKHAGYDGVIISGKADRPIYLAVEDDDVQIKDAAGVWGLDTFESQKRLIASHPKATALVIGPAGENRSRIAVLLNETANAFGQGGYGGVFGSKNLKAIVVRGTNALSLARPDAYLDLIRQAKAAGDFKIGDHQSWGRYPLGPVEIRLTMMDYLVKFCGCYGCPHQCNGVYDVPGIGIGGQMCMESWYGNYSGGSAEAMWDGNIMSQRLGINNCELLGMMSFIQRAVARGAVSVRDLGLSSVPMIHNATEMEFGGQEVHHKFLEELLGAISSGDSLFSQGVARAAQQLGPAAVSEYEAVFPAHGSRTHHVEGVGPALIWATDARDPYDSVHDSTECFARNKSIADYWGVRGGYIPAEGQGRRQMIYEGAEKEAVWVQNHQCLKNSLPICEYASYPDHFFHPPDLDVRRFESKMLSAVTGVDFSVEALWDVGERIMSLRRAVMVQREDRHRDDDTLTQFYFEHVGTTGEELGAPLERVQWEAAKDRYYQLRGWEVKTGRPTRTTLDALGLGQVARRLQEAGKLGQ